VERISTESKANPRKVRPFITEHEEISFVSDKGKIVAKGYLNGRYGAIPFPGNRKDHLGQVCRSQLNLSMKSLCIQLPQKAERSSPGLVK
jgi:hypothetical protein